MPEETAQTRDLLRDASNGDALAWGALLMEHESRLARMVAFRLDPRLHGRVDAADVVQDAFLEASAHRADYFRNAGVPLFLWLRGVVSNKLLEVHRHHLGTRKRDAAREISMNRNATTPGGGGETSAALVAQLSASITRPSVAAARSESSDAVRKALGDMEEIDREVLALRHFEQLSNAEAAHVLGIQERAAAKRYLRALKRLKEVLAELPGGLSAIRPS
jgi:RNA polymerase sigma-70 factor (ECF subfamily)